MQVQTTNRWTGADISVNDTSRMSAADHKQFWATIAQGGGITPDEAHNILATGGTITTRDHRYSRYTG